ncbi:MAG: DNA-directed RNA polymerase subunit D [archaeon]
MKIRILNKSNSKLRFVLEDSDVGFANALRRTMLSELPTLAIEDVTFFENTSALYNELVAHRLGLIPLTTDLKTFKLPGSCGCKGKGCPKCQLIFTLVRKGPGMVYSGDLKSSDPKIKVADDKIPIVKLLEHQNIKLEATAILGQGKTHAKWQPGIIAYQYYPNIDVKKQTCIKSAKEVCPKDVFDDKGVAALEKCDLCRECVDVCGKDAIEVTGINTKFLFNIETNGSHKPESIVIESAKYLGEKAKEFEKELK